ncbi:hypothetical protein D3C72_1951560 [compost metagenome]
MPMMLFIGVRISWLMFDRKSLLAWLAASACSFRRCSSVTSVDRPIRPVTGPGKPSGTFTLHR